jgi:transcriptional regulator with XRE-family HTH domain
LREDALSEPEEEELPMLIQRVLEEGPFSMHQLAAESGISYDTLYSWAKSRREPRPDTLRQLAAGLRQRSERLAELAADLERKARQLEAA